MPIMEMQSIDRAEKFLFYSLCNNCTELRKFRGICCERSPWWIVDVDLVLTQFLIIENATMVVNRQMGAVRMRSVAGHFINDSLPSLTAEFVADRSYVTRA